MNVHERNIGDQDAYGVGQSGIPRRARPKRHAGRLFIMVLTVVLVGNAIVGERGLLALLRVQRESVVVARLIETLRAQNDALRERVRQLRDEPRAIEEVARRDLGLIEPGEMLFIVSDVPKPAHHRAESD